MSDDIVARLRGHIAITTRIHYAKDGFPEPVYVHGPSPICQEAAGEIERLRKELAACCRDHGPGAHTAGPVEHFIPEAL